MYAHMCIHTHIYIYIYIQERLAGSFVSCLVMNTGPLLVEIISLYGNKAIV